jgi:enoyl-CoA hydratase/carnithine racemase
MIQLSIDGPVAALVLDRPQVRNALASSIGRRLRGRRAKCASVRTACSDGAARASAPGADSEFPDFSAMRLRASASAPHARDRAVAPCPLATIAWIDGPCFGAGVALAMAADIRIAAPTASFAITPAKIGIGYPQEDVARLVALVGPDGRLACSSRAM